MEVGPKWSKDILKYNNQTDISFLLFIPFNLGLYLPTKEKGGKINLYKSYLNLYYSVCWVGLQNVYPYIYRDINKIKYYLRTI